MLTELPVVVAHEVTNRSRTGRTSIFAEQQGLTMNADIVPAGEQPMRVHRELAYEGDHDLKRDG